jgi:hypothetical protein
VNDTIARIRTLAGAAVTWMLLASAVVSAVVAEVGTDIPWVAEWGGQVVVWIGTAIAIVRFVSPAAKDDRGLT